jgi:hypothetical protein
MPSFENGCMEASGLLAPPPDAPSSSVPAVSGRKEPEVEKLAFGIVTSAMSEF